MNTMLENTIRKLSLTIDTFHDPCAEWYKPYKGHEVRMRPVLSPGDSTTVKTWIPDPEQVMDVELGIEHMEWERE